MGKRKIIQNVPIDDVISITVHEYGEDTEIRINTVDVRYAHMDYTCLYLSYEEAKEFHAKFAKALEIAQIRFEDMRGQN